MGAELCRLAGEEQNFKQAAVQAGESEGRARIAASTGVPALSETQTSARVFMS